MPVLAKLGDQQLGRLAERAGKLFQSVHENLVFRLALVCRPVDLAHHLGHRDMVAKGLAHRIGNLAERCAGARRLDGGLEDVTLASAGHLAQCVERRFPRFRIALAAGLLDAGDLGLAHRLVVDVEDFEIVLVLQAVLVDADDHLVAAVDGRLLAGRRLLDQALG